MKAILKFRRRIERQWAEQVEALMQIYGRVDVTAERAWQLIFNNDRSLIPAPARVVNRRFDQARSRD